MEKKLKSQEETLQDVYYRVTPAQLTQVVKDWQGQFPELKRYKSTQKLFKRLGPVLIGIELEKYLASSYRPRFVAYNLLENNRHGLIPIIDQTLKTNMGNYLSIRYKDHETEYMQACELMKQQSYISLDTVLYFSEILEGIAKCGKYGISTLQRILQLSSLLKSKELKGKYSEWVIDKIKRIQPDLLKEYAGNVEEWLKILMNFSYSNVDMLIEESIKKYKLQNIPNFDIIL